MFKCKECGTEYQTKPDYCDCGNDTFEEVLPPKPAERENTTVETKDDMWVEENGFGYPVDEQSYNNMQKESEKRTVKNNVQTVQPYAIITFAVCLILSLLIILFAFNPKNISEQNSNTKSETIKTQQVPSIEKIWNNSTEGLSEYQSKAKVEQTEQTKPIVKQEETSKKKIEVTKPKKQEVKSTVKTIPTTAKTTNNIQKTKTQIQQKITPSANTTQANKPKANPQEIANYNIKLRNHIASKINFLSIVGDGTCTFSFKVTSEGTLTNKKATKLSENESLNEAVYNALRQVYSYNAPPIGYKSEMLNLTVKMYNNSYEVYLN